MEDNVKGFPGYHVTRDGELYKNGKKQKLFYHHRYLRRIIRNGSIIKNIKIHRLVAEAYIPNPENKPLVMHLDDNPLNNHVSNLRWGTHKENLESALLNGKTNNKIGKNNPMYGMSGYLNPNHKLSRLDLELIKKLHEEGFTARYIWKEYFPNVCEQTICRNIRRMFNHKKV